MANNINGASLNPIYQRLHDAPQYHPLEADTFADWAMEAGDIVTVSRDGKSYESPVHSSTVTWKKGQQVTVSSTGQEKRDSVTKMSQKKYNRGSSGLRNSENRYRQIVTSYNEMTAGLILASSSAALYVNNKYTQMQSGLFLTESSAHLYTNNKYTQMQSGLKLTESSAHLYTNNKYTQMSSGLKLTESSAHLYTNNKYTQMSSGLKLSESSARLYVDNKYTQMQSGLAVTMSSAILYAQNRTTRAYIMTRINADGEGEAIISADKVSITGNSTISGSLEVGASGGIIGLIVKKTAFFAGDINLTTANSVVHAPILQCGTNGYLRLYGATSATHYELTAAALGAMIKTASVANNILTLTQWDGTVINFSKAATTPTLSGSWSSGVLTVTSTPSPASDYTIGFSTTTKDTNLFLYTNGTPTLNAFDNTKVDAPVRISTLDSVSPPVTTDRYTTTLTIDATAAYNAGRNSYSTMTLTRVVAGYTETKEYVYYGKLYYYDEFNDRFVEAYNSNQYWYRSSTNLGSGSKTVRY